MKWIKSIRMLLLKTIQMCIKYPSLYLLDKNIWVHFTHWRDDAFIFGGLSSRSECDLLSNSGS